MHTIYTLGGRKDEKKRTEQDLQKFKNPFFEFKDFNYEAKNYISDSLN